ncbi:MAG: methionine--tRNA ligase [Methanomicrobiales archaeon]
MSDTPLLVTCGLPYTNGPCHIGHLRTYIPADCYVRFMRRSGEEVVFVCGSDNHGTPIVISAEQEGVSPRDLSERYHAHFDATFRRVGVRFDHFGMTDDPTNHARTRHIVERLIDRGYVYAEIVSQSYCPRCERFLPDRYVEGICPHCGERARGDECDQGCGQHLEPGEIREPVCRVCGSRAEFREQEHFFFRLSDFQEFLLAYLPGLGGTANARNYALGWVREDLHDWCITRTLDWGVPFPGRDDLVVYVWVDAPIGYISFTEELTSEWTRYWCGDSRIIHFIGGDIIYHHCIFWPALLRGAGYGVPDSVVASGMVKVEDRKFSKSRGYVVWANDDYLDQGLPADYLRYYLLSYTNHTKELNFSWQVFADRVNNELVGTLGNFLYRCMHFTHSRWGSIPVGEISPEISSAIDACITDADRHMREFEFKGAIEAIMALASFGNTYIQNQAPWAVIKDDPESAALILKNCLQLARALALIIEPVMPDAAQRIWEGLGYEDRVSDHSISEARETIGTRPIPRPAPLFEKIDEETLARLEERLAERVQEARSMSEAKTTTISIDEFARLDLRTGRVLEAEPIPKSDRLLRLIVDIGDEKRQIVAGIAPFHAPDELVGEDVVIAANLEPATIFGVESRGMLLAAGDQASLLVPKKMVEPGTRIK